MAKTPNARRGPGRPRSWPDPVTEGQRQLQAVMRGGLTFEAVQVALELSAISTLQQWVHGTTRPNHEARARMAGAYGIPVRAWDVRAGVDCEGDTTAPAPPPPVQLTAPDACPPAAATGPRPTTLDQCLSVLDALREARAVPGLIATERIKLADSEGRMLALRARLERDAERTEDRIVREHPEWHRIKRLIVKVLSAHPAAMKDLAAALDPTLDGGPHADGVD